MASLPLSNVKVLICPCLLRSWDSCEGEGEDGSSGNVDVMAGGSEGARLLLANVAGEADPGDGVCLREDSGRWRRGGRCVVVVFWQSGYL